MNDKDKPYVPQEIDDMEDRMGSIEQLDFNTGDERLGRTGERLSDEELRDRFPPKRVREAGMTGGEALGPDIHEDGITQDDLSPETLYDESGARSPNERGHGRAADESLSVVQGSEIGGGYGLDEAELAQVLPLDGEPETPPGEEPIPKGNDPADHNPPRKGSK